MRARKKGLTALIIIFILVIIFGSIGFLYWKFSRIMRSVSDSAQKARSQNTPLLDE